MKKPPLRGNSVRFAAGVRYPSAGRSQQGIKDDVGRHHHTAEVRFIILVEYTAGRRELQLEVGVGSGREQGDSVHCGAHDGQSLTIGTWDVVVPFYIPLSSQ